MNSDVIIRDSDATCEIYFIYIHLWPFLTTRVSIKSNLHTSNGPLFNSGALTPLVESAEG